MTLSVEKLEGRGQLHHFPRAHKEYLIECVFYQSLACLNILTVQFPFFVLRYLVTFHVSLKGNFVSLIGKITRYQ